MFTWLLLSSQCLYHSSTCFYPPHLLPLLPPPKTPYIWIQTGAKLSQQLLHPLQTRPVFLELLVGKASTSNGRSPRDLYEKHTREKGWDSQWKERDWDWKGRDTPCAWQWGDHSISIALWPLMLITPDRPASSILLLIKTKRNTAMRHLEGLVGQCRLPNFCFISKEKQGQRILGNRVHLCVSLSPTGNWM